MASAWAFGHYTHEKNPVTTRAALTTIEIIEEEGWWRTRRGWAPWRSSGWTTMKRRLPAIGDVRGRGLLLGIELVRSRDDKAARRRTSPRPCSIARWIAACRSRPRWATC